MRLAKVNNDNIVIDLVSGEQLNFPDYIDVTNLPCGIGWLYDGETFSSIDEIEEDLNA